MSARPLMALQALLLLASAAPLGCMTPSDRAFVNVGPPGNEVGVPQADIDRYAAAHGVSREQATAEFRKRYAEESNSTATGHAIASDNPATASVASVKPGDTCLVALSPAEIGGTTYREQLRGTVKSVDGDKIVLADVARISEATNGLPILEKVPYASRLFKNKAVAADPVRGDVTIARSEIESLQRIDPADVPNERLGVEIGPDRQPYDASERL
ncbi:MAG: hypothetical protein ACOY3P_10945 [Planctomycetota bacterium]